MRQSLKWILPASALSLMFTLGLNGVALAQDAAPAAEGKGTITGTVVAEDGSAVADLEVRVMPPPPPRDGEGPRRNRANEQAADDQKKGDHPDRPEPVATATTDADGKFSVEVPAGTYVVIAGKPGKGMGRQRVTVADGETKTVELKLKKGKRGEGAPKRPGKKAPQE